MLALVRLHLHPVLYPSCDELLNESMHVWASLTTSQHRERKKGVGSGERAPILVFLAFDCVGVVFSCRACFILQIEAGVRVNDGNIE